MTRYEYVPLSELLVRREDAVEVDSTAEYPNFGIYSYGKGVFAKAPISGASTSATTLFRASANQFVYSRLFAFEGAYAVVPSEFDGYFVSNEFPLFECHADRLRASFLATYFRSPTVWQRVAQAAVGVGHRRQRVQPATFLRQSIPLPDLREQDRIVRVVERLDNIRQLHFEAQSVTEQALLSFLSDLLG